MKRKKSFKWFKKSIKEGERLAARPDLARTYMEVGKRLLEPQSKHNLNISSLFAKAKVKVTTRICIKPKPLEHGVLL